MSDKVVFHINNYLILLFPKPEICSPVLMIGVVERYLISKSNSNGEIFTNALDFYDLSIEF